MNKNQRVEATTQLLRGHGWNSAEAKSMAKEAIENGEPILEFLCFSRLVTHTLVPIHQSSWVAARSKRSDCEEGNVVKRLLDSGASADDLALFARMMQRECLSNLGCLLDGSGIGGTPALSFGEFRVFAVDESDAPLAVLDELHSTLCWSDLETEMQQSRQVEEDFDREVNRSREAQ